MLARSLLAVVLLAGCAGGGTDLDDPEHVTAWANSASALAVFAPAYEPLATADGVSSFDDASCPQVEDDGTTLTIGGDCTDESGTQWIGSARVVRGADGTYELSLEGYGSGDANGSPARVTGTFRIAPTDDGAHTFIADYVQEGPLTLEVDYEGRVEGDYDSATLWSGSGTVARSGSTDVSGTAQATTTDQFRDATICPNQSLSGSTLLLIDERTLLIEYDGATNCDEALTARYFVDGEERGTVEGITCSASSPRRGARNLSALVLPVTLAAIVSRRARKR